MDTDTYHAAVLIMLSSPGTAQTRCNIAHKEAVACYTGSAIPAAVQRHGYGQPLQPHLVGDGTGQDLLGGDALQCLGDCQTGNGVLQVEALAEHLQGHAGVAAQGRRVARAAQKDCLNRQVPWAGIIQLDDCGLWPVDPSESRTEQVRGNKRHRTSSTGFGAWLMTMWSSASGRCCSRRLLDDMGSKDLGSHHTDASQVHRDTQPPGRW